MMHVAKFYQHQLKHHQNSAQVIDYLKGRLVKPQAFYDWLRTE